MIAKLGILALTAVSLSACVGSPRQYETTPVEISTPKGNVTCQLYTREQVIWDRAIARPNNMSTTEADNYCIAEGRRQQQGQ